MQLVRIAQLRSYKAGEIIAQEGEIFEKVLAIRNGIIRTYVLRTDGEEKTTRLAREGDFAACSSCFIAGDPSVENLQAVEACKVIVLRTAELRSLTHENARLLRLWSDALGDALYDAVQRIQFFTTLTPEERYRQLLAEAPELVQRVPQKYLASYIGVTTVSLSRIRSRVAQHG